MSESYPNKPDSEKLKFIQNDEELMLLGITRREGAMNNKTDCEWHYIYTHLPTGETKDCHGTLYDRDFVSDIYNWIVQFR